MGTSNTNEEYKMKYKPSPYINKKKENNHNNSNNISETDENNNNINNSNNIPEKDENNNINKSNIIQEKEENNKSINISEKKEKTINVKIKSQSDIWEKEYNIKTPLSQIESDFLKGINNENNSIEFILNNSPIIMDSRPLESIITEEDQKEIIIEQKIKEEIPNDEKFENIETIDYIGRPIANPFEIYVFDIKKKLIKRLKYAIEKIKMLGLDKYGINSSFCNGMNHLFISGGTNPVTNDAINLFWDLDIENSVLKKKIRMPCPKQNHNMIYFQDNVYIIGGDDEKTMFYDVKNMVIGDWPSLNQKKFKPSLIIYNNILFCIDSSQKFLPEYNIEKIEMVKSDSVWEIVKPKINNDISKFIFSQKFFGLIEDKNENIIFLGGIFDNDNLDDNLILQYNVKKNLIEKGEKLNLVGINDIKNLILDEKSFLKIDGNTSAIFPYFISREPKILYYYKDKNQLQMKLYHSNPNLTKLHQEQKTIKMEGSLKGKEENKQNNNINVSINAIENNFVGKKISNNENGKKYNYILNKNKKNNDSDNNVENLKNPPNNNISIEKNSSDSNIDNNKGNKNNNIDKSKNSDKNEENNISKKNSESNKREEEKNSKISDININKNEGNHINKKNSESNKGEEKKNSKISEIEEKVTNKPQKIEKEKEDDNNKSKSDEKKSEIKKDDIKENSNEKDEKEKEKKIDVETFNTDLGSYFHSSVNRNVMNNFRKLENNRAIKNNIRMKNIIQPKEINVKTLKQSRKKFNNFQFNDIEEFTNY